MAFCCMRWEQHWSLWINEVTFLISHHLLFLFFCSLCLTDLHGQISIWKALEGMRWAWQRWASLMLIWFGDCHLSPRVAGLCGSETEGGGESSACWKLERGSVSWKLEEQFSVSLMKGIGNNPHDEHLSAEIADGHRPIFFEQNSRDVSSAGILWSMGIDFPCFFVFLNKCIFNLAVQIKKSDERRWGAEKEVQREIFCYADSEQFDPIRNEWTNQQQQKGCVAHEKREVFRNVASMQLFILPTLWFKPWFLGPSLVSVWYIYDVLISKQQQK